VPAALRTRSPLTLGFPPLRRIEQDARSNALFFIDLAGNLTLIGDAYRVQTVTGSPPAHPGLWAGRRNRDLRRTGRDWIFASAVGDFLYRRQDVVRFLIQYIQIRPEEIQDDAEV